MPKIIYETYTCSKDHNMIEWGYCFKEEGFEEGDCVLDDMVLGEQDASTPGLIAKVEKSWDDNEHAARAICQSREG